MLVLNNTLLGYLLLACVMEILKFWVKHLHVLQQIIDKVGQVISLVLLLASYSVVSPPLE